MHEAYQEMPEEHLTAGELAARLSLGQMPLVEKMLFTGRMIVKKAFENTVISTDYNRESLFYMSPELRPSIKMIDRLFLPQHKMGEVRRRMLFMNRMAVEEPERVVIYGPDGRFDPTEA